MRLASPLRFSLVLVWLVAALVPRASQAQSDPARLVAAREAETEHLAATWLASPDPRVRARGAYLASGLTRLTSTPDQRDIVRELTTQVESYRPPATPPSLGDRDEHDAMAAVLDALIQTGWDFQLRRASVAALYQEFPAPIVVLLTRGAGGDPFAWDIVRHEPVATGVWLAGLDMLQRAHAAGLALYLLAGLTIEAHVTVLDAHPIPGKGGLGGSCFVGGSPPPWPGWPPIGNYLLRSGSKGTLVVDGADPILYTRNVGLADLGPLPDDYCSRISDGNRLRVRVLAKMSAESPDHPSVDWTAADTVDWHGADAFSSELHEFIRIQETVVTSLIVKLVTAGQMTADEASTVRPTLEVRIDDLRGQQGTALPQLADLPGNVRIVK